MQLLAADVVLVRSPQLMCGQTTLAPLALSGPRFELFSMTAAVACGPGLALLPRLLIEAELMRDELVIANLQSPPTERYDYLVQAGGSDAKPVLQHFTRWLRQVSASR